MRWFKRIKKQKTRDYPSKERTILRFLLFPRCIKGEWRWLEFAYIYQVYTINDNGVYMAWKDMAWVDEKRDHGGFYV